MRKKQGGNSRHPGTKHQSVFTLLQGGYFGDDNALVWDVEIAGVDILVGRVRVSIGSGGENGASDPAGACIQIRSGMDAEGGGPKGCLGLAHNRVREVGVPGELIQRTNWPQMSPLRA